MKNFTNTSGRIITGLLAAMVFLAAFYGCTRDKWGHFEGEVVVKMLEDGRNMLLLQDFAYVDPKGKKWVSPKDSVINGASIPQPFWSIIGGPFEGKYRQASVVHDTECLRNKNEKEESWQDVHKMFYQACRCGGVAEFKAKFMYWAVFHFGPRWSGGVPGEIEIDGFDPVPIDKQIVTLVRNGKVSSSAVYSTDKVLARADLMTRIHDEKNKLHAARTDLKATGNFMTVLKLQERDLEGLLQEIQAEKDRAEGEHLLRMVEKKEATALSRLNSVRENLREKETELLNRENTIETTRIRLAELEAMKQPDEELVDIALVAGQVEKYITRKKLSLSDIESLQLEEALK